MSWSQITRDPYRRELRARYTSPSAFGPLPLRDELGEEVEDVVPDAPSGYYTISRTEQTLQVMDMFDR